MNITIIACSIEESNLSFPLGAIQIYSALKHSTVNQDDSNIQLLSYYCSTPIAAAVEELRKHPPEAIGCSIYLWNATWFLRLLEALQEILPSGVTYFAGGPEITASPETYLKKGFHFLTIGEGEIATITAFEYLLSGRPLEGIPGIYTPDMAQKPPQTSIQQLELMISPYEQELIRGKESVLWELTRGCPYQCSFCFESKGDQSIRRIAKTRMQEELAAFLKAGVQHLFVLDPTFNRDKSRAKEILRYLIAETRGAIHFEFEIRAELLDEEMADLFSQLYCSLQIGLQSSDIQVMKQLNRAFQPGLFKKHISLLTERGVVFGLDLIYGLPGDTLEGFKRSIDFAISQLPSNLDIFPLAILPGTALAEQAEALGIIWSKESPYLVAETPGFSPADMEEAKRLALASDIFYTKGEASVWFYRVAEGAGLTPSAFLLAAYHWLYDLLKKEEVLAPEAETFSIDDVETIDPFELQLLFISDIYTKSGNTKLLPAARSFCLLHQGISQYIAADEQWVLPLDYRPEQLMHLDHESIPQFVARFPKSPCRIYPYFDEDQLLFSDCAEE